jgi:hypothetical protein
VDHERGQVPINVAVKEPRARVVGEEPDRDTISNPADVHHVADDRVFKVVRRIASTPDYGERMAM